MKIFTPHKPWCFLCKKDVETTVLLDDDDDEGLCAACVTKAAELLGFDVYPKGIPAPVIRPHVPGGVIPHSDGDLE